MDIQSEVTLSFYNVISNFNTHKKIDVVQHIDTKEIFLKKQLSIYNKRIYDYLKVNQVKNIPQIIEAIVDEDKLIIIEEYITGKTLADIIEKNNTLDEATAANYIEQLISILSSLHNSHPSIIHRDIKPANIMISNDGTVKLIDFNAAKFVDVEDYKEQDTILIGTQGYASPEQYGFRTSDCRSDIYSLGMLFNFMLTGNCSNQNIHPGMWHDIIAKCLELDPKNRYMNVDELSNAMHMQNNSKSKKAKLKPANESTKVQKLSNYTIPGFRTKSWYKMIIAIIGYISIIYCTFTLAIVDSTLYQLYTGRIAAFIALTIPVFLISNYLDIRRFFLFCNSKYMIIRTIASIVWSFILSVSVLFLWSLIIAIILSFTA